MFTRHKVFLIILVYGAVMHSSLSFATDYCQSFAWNVDKDLIRLDSFFAWDGSSPLNLYSTSNFSLKPKFTLDREGFKSNKGLFCFWEADKSSKKKSRMLLIPSCEEYLDMATSVGTSWSSSGEDAQKCKVIKLSHYDLNAGSIVAKVKYDDVEYYLNPSEYLQLLEPGKISLKEDRENYLEKSWKLFTGWPGSCFGSWEIKRPPELHSKSNDYLFFSLSGLFGTHYREVEQELRFYKGRDYSSVPDYILDSKGLRGKDKVICSWKYPYSEKILFKNYLDCEKEEQKLVQFFSRSEGHLEPETYCAVLVPKSIEEVNGIFSFKFQIGKDAYYLDTKDMPRISNGFFLSTSEKRKRESLEIESKRQKKVKDNLGLLKNHVDLSKIKDCINTQSEGCLIPYLSDTFISEVTQIFKLSDDEDNPCKLNVKSQMCLKFAYQESLKVIIRSLEIVEKVEIGKIRFVEHRGKKMFTVILNESQIPGIDPDNIVIEIDEKGALKLKEYNFGFGC